MANAIPLSLIHCSNYIHVSCGSLIFKLIKLAYSSIHNCYRYITVYDEFAMYEIYNHKQIHRLYKTDIVDFIKPI